MTVRLKPLESQTNFSLLLVVLVLLRSQCFTLKINVLLIRVKLRRFCINEISIRFLEEMESTSCGSNEETLLDKRVLMEVWKDLTEQTRDWESSHRLATEESFYYPKESFYHSKVWSRKGTKECFWVPERPTAKKSLSGNCGCGGGSKTCSTEVSRE